VARSSDGLKVWVSGGTVCIVMYCVWPVSGGIESTAGVPRHPLPGGRRKELRGYHAARQQVHQVSPLWVTELAQHGSLVTEN